MKQPTKVLCLQCANLFRSSSKGELTCPNCGWAIDAADFRDLYSEAERVLRFGHFYRERYERQLTGGGRIMARACLAETPQWLVFVGIAVLQQIIGGGAYDVVKHVIKRLYARRPKGAGYGRIRLSDDDMINMLVQHSREYLDGMPNVEPELREAIAHEEHAHLVGRSEAIRHALAKPSRKSDSDSRKKARQQILEAALRTIVKKIKSGDTSYMDRARMQQLLSNVWNELPE
jgi:hypothetical protein